MDNGSMRKRLRPLSIRISAYRSYGRAREHAAAQARSPKTSGSRLGND